MEKTNSFYEQMLNNYFDYLEKIKEGPIGFYYENIEFLTDLLFSYYSIVEQMDIKETKKEYVKEMDYDLLEQVLIKTSSKIVDKYYELEQKNSIEIVYNLEEGPDRISRYGRDKLILAFGHNYDYLSTIVHELMHATNTKTDVHKLTPVLLTEFISIYFELYAKDVISELGIDKKNISYFSRFKSDMNKLDTKVLIPFLLKKKYGLISKENLEKLHNEKHYYDNIEDYDFDSSTSMLCNYIYKDGLDSDKTKKNMVEASFFSFNPIIYSLGCCLAFYAKKNMTKFDMLELNDTIIKDPDINVFDLLSKYNIHFNQDFIDSAISSIKDYYNLHKSSILNV